MQHTPARDGGQSSRDCFKSETALDLIDIIDECEAAERAQVFAPRESGQGERASGLPAAAAPLHRLESRDNNVTRVILTKHKCRCRTCEVCGKKRGHATRQKLLGKSELWRTPALFTLTPDRKKFSSPAHAWRTITEGKYVARLMRLLGVKLWMWVLEYQQKTGTGWPHWHLLIDLADLPGERLDLKKAWKLWNKTWGIGGLDLSPPDEDVSKPDHAILYITKYLMKQPEGGYPTWVLKSKRAVRFCQGSKRLGPIVSDATNDDADAESDREGEQAEDDQRRPRKPLLDRMMHCQQSGRVFEMRADPSTGEERAVFAGVLPCSPERLLGMSKRGEIAARIDEETDDEGRATITLKTPLRGLQLEVRRLWWQLAGDTWDRARMNRRQLLAENRFAKREFLQSKALDMGGNDYYVGASNGEQNQGFDRDESGPGEAARPLGESRRAEQIGIDRASCVGRDRAGGDVHQSDTAASTHAGAGSSVLTTWRVEADGGDDERRNER